MRRRKVLTKAQRARRERLKTIGKWTGLTILVYELYLAMVNRRQKRRDAFNAALQRNVETSKPLLVIGDPDGRLLSRILGRDSDCGDMCLDLRGCSKCQSGEPGDPFERIKQLGTNASVVFVDTGQLERVPDMPAALSELQRISGGDLFIAHIEPWSLLSLLPPYKRRIKSAPPTTPYTEWRDLPWTPGPAELKRLP
jgi:hypothetical protein